MAQAARRSRCQVRAARRGDHGQGQRRGSVALRGHPARDPGRRGRHGPEQRRDRGDRDGRRWSRGRGCTCEGFDRDCGRGGSRGPGRQRSQGRAGGDIRACAGRGARASPGGRACRPWSCRLGRAARSRDSRPRRDVGPDRDSRSRSQDDPRGPAPPSRARTLGCAGRRYWRRRSDHARGRAQARRGDPDRHGSTGTRQHACRGARRSAPSRGTHIVRSRGRVPGWCRRSPAPR